MTWGLVAVLLVQFLSALGDNALIFAAIAQLNAVGSPAWQIPVLQQSFVLAFILLAPFVGQLADALPKGRVLALGNSVKALGALAMILGAHPLAGYACVGVGAAIYSPAKYGILTEMVPPERLIWANGWMEGMTVAATILGALTGGLLVSENAASLLPEFVEYWPLPGPPPSSPLFAVLAVAGLYVLSVIASGAVPKSTPQPTLDDASGGSPSSAFIRSLQRLWADESGRISIILTSLLWGLGTTLRFVILAWASEVCLASLERGAQLTAAVMLGIGIGAAWAGSKVPLAQAFGVVKFGTLMGFAVMSVAWVHDCWQALPLMLCVGALGGYLIVPMNAVLQDRGNALVGAGHSIALQNLGENISILLMLGTYALLVRLETPVAATITLLGASIVAVSIRFVSTRP